MPADAPHAPQLSDAEVENWIALSEIEAIKAVEMGLHAAMILSARQKVAFLRSALALRKRLDDPNVVESAAGDGSGVSFTDCVDLILLYRQYLLRAEGPDAALRAAVMGEE